MTHPITLARTGQVLVKTTTETVVLRHKTAKSRHTVAYLVVGVHDETYRRPCVAPLAKHVIDRVVAPICDEKGAPTGSASARTEFEIAPFVLSGRPEARQANGEPGLVPIGVVFDRIRANVTATEPDGRALRYGWVHLDKSDQAAKVANTTVEWQLYETTEALRDNIFLDHTVVQAPPVY